MIIAKAPGKLYIAGEYAVVENQYPAVLVALNQFVTCTIRPTSHLEGSITSHQYENMGLSWRRNGDQMVIDRRDNPFVYILSAISVTEEYAKALHKPLGVYDLTIDSQLDSDSGKKYGLGSSAAVTVATVKALLNYYAIPASKEVIFKLASIAHFTIQGNGSLGDVAASVYGGWIAYRSFDRAWLANQRQRCTLVDLISQTWPGLEIESLIVPNELQLMIGWTGKPASTSHLVDKIDAFHQIHPEQYQEFLENSRQCVERMVDGFHRQDIATIQNELRNNRLLLQSLAIQSEVQIETPLLQQLCQIAEQFKGAAKTSGAGGGDCGIAILSHPKDRSRLTAAWQAAGIEPLNLAIHYVDEVISESV